MFLTASSAAVFKVAIFSFLFFFFLICPCCFSSSLHCIKNMSLLIKTCQFLSEICQIPSQTCQMTSKTCQMTSKTCQFPSSNTYYLYQFLDLCSFHWCGFHLCAISKLYLFKSCGLFLHICVSYLDGAGSFTHAPKTPWTGLTMDEYFQKITLSPFLDIDITDTLKLDMDI